jgi:hypothetical protein
MNNKMYNVNEWKKYIDDELKTKTSEDKHELLDEKRENICEYYAMHRRSLHDTCMNKYEKLYNESENEKKKQIEKINEYYSTKITSLINNYEKDDLKLSDETDELIQFVKKSKKNVFNNDNDEHISNKKHKIDNTTMIIKNNTFMTTDTQYKYKMAVCVVCKFNFNIKTTYNGWYPTCPSCQ